MNEMVAPVFEKGYPSYEAVNRSLQEQEHDGMQCDHFSEPLDDLDYSSDHPQYRETTPN